MVKRVEFKKALRIGCLGICLIWVEDAEAQQRPIELRGMKTVIRRAVEKRLWVKESGKERGCVAEVQGQ